MTDTAPLFRPQPALYRGSRLGRATIGVPLPVWVLAMLLTVTVLALAGFLSFGRYARKETVAGYVASDGAADVYAGTQGVIEAVHVHLGDHVSAGDPLFSVRNASELRHGGNVSRRLSEGIRRQMDDVDAERASVETLFRQRTRRLDHELAATRASLARAASGVSLVRQRLTLAERSVAARAALTEARAMSQEALRQGRAQLLAVRLELQQAQAHRSELASQAPALRLEREETVAERDRRLAELSARLEALRARLVESQARQSLLTVAPIDGVVAFSQVLPGQAASPRQPAMTLVPEHGPLGVRLLIPSRARAFVEPGQKVHVKFDAFPYQHFGTGEGVVTGVSRAAVPGGRLRTPIASPGPFYVASVTLRRDRVWAYGRGYPLRPGMTLTADVVLAERRLIEWLVEPLLRVRA